MMLEHLPTEVLQRIFDNFSLYRREDGPNAWRYCPGHLTAGDRNKTQTLFSLCLVNKRISVIASLALCGSLSRPIREDGAVSVRPSAAACSLPSMSCRTQALHLFDSKTSPPSPGGVPISTFENLQFLSIACRHLTPTQADTLRSAMEGLRRCCYLELQCDESEILVIAKLLSPLTGSHVYEGLRLTNPPSGLVLRETTVRVKRLHFISRFQMSPWNGILPMLVSIDSGIVEEMDFDLGARPMPEIFLADVLNVRWPTLRRLTVKHSKFSHFSGFGQAGNAPCLRTLTLDEVYLHVNLQAPGQSTAASTPLLERILISLPPTVKNLYLGNFSAPDRTGLLALMRLMRHPDQPLQNVSFIQFRELGCYLADPVRESDLCLRQIRDVIANAKMFEGMAKDKGVRLEPWSLQYEAERALSLWVK